MEFNVKLFMAEMGLGFQIGMIDRIIDRPNLEKTKHVGGMKCKTKFENKIHAKKTQKQK